MITSKLVLFASIAMAAGAAAVAVSAASLGIKDMTGQVLPLEKPATRIVTFPVPAAAIVIGLDGGPQHVVGMHTSSKDAVANSVLGAFYPEAKAISSNIIAAGAAAGFAPNVEAVAALRPDLVIQWGDQPDVVAPLRNAGLTTGLILYGDDKLAREMVAFVGASTGNGAKAAALNAWRDTTQQAISAKTSALAGAQKPKVLYLIRAKTALQAMGGGTYNDWYINLAGGVNAAADLAGQKPVNPEQIAAWNPDVILLNNFEDPLDLSPIYGNPVLAQTKAATAKRVYKMPMGGYRWDPPSHESPLTWMWLADVLHPELFSFDVRAEVKVWYPKIYDRVPTDAQVDNILHLDINKASAGYQRFAAK